MKQTMTSKEFLQMLEKVPELRELTFRELKKVNIDKTLKYLGIRKGDEK